MTNPISEKEKCGFSSKYLSFNSDVRPLVFTQQKYTHIVTGLKRTKLL